MIITRFAPSPTGALHLGGARTALFNFLFAKKHEGKFLLRIEDTDKKRNQKESLDSILNGLQWLGLDWNDEPIYQSARAVRHQEVAAELLAKGAAYYCDCSPETIATEREKALAEKRPVRYSRTCRERNLTSGALRIKIPLDGAVTIDDRVLGETTTQNNQLDDFIILRSDGSPTYMLCVVVDDHDMAISHIMRGNDHATNAVRQAVIYSAMGWQMPVFAHLPLIHGSDGARLSKRHGSRDINEYQTDGYLPEAIRNYLSRLGWAHGDDEIFSTDEAVGWFSLEGIGKSPARFDPVKLDSLNNHYLKSLPDDSLVALFTKQLELEKNDKYQDFIPVLHRIAERSKTLTEFAKNAKFLVEYKDNSGVALDKSLISGIILQLEQAEWNKDNLEGIVRAFAEKNGGLKETAQAMRVAIVGQKNAPSIFEVIAALGKNETLDRLKRKLWATQ